LIVSFFGPDGSGKTSIANAIKKDHKIVSIRGTHTLASVIALFLNRFTVFRGKDNPYYEISIPEKMRSLWCIMEFISTLPHILYRFGILPKFKSVVAERSIPDFVAWVAVTTKNPSFTRSFLGTFLLALARKQGRLVYVTASMNELCRRRPESTELINKQVPVYNVLAKLLNSTRLDTTLKTVEESSKEIRKVIFS
jgi:hypothetical protein